MLTRAWRYGRMIWFIRAEVFPVIAVGTGKPLLCIWKVWKNVDILIRDFNEYSHDIAYSLNRIQGGLATAFDLAAFRLSMIAPVKKSVSHSRTVASVRETGWEKQQKAHLRSDSTVCKWIRVYNFSPVGHCFLSTVP